MVRFCALLFIFQVVFGGASSSADASTLEESFEDRRTASSIDDLFSAGTEPGAHCSLHPNLPITAAELRGEFNDTAHPVGVPMSPIRQDRLRAQLDQAGLLLDGQEYRCDSEAYRAQWQRGVEDALGGQRFLRSFSGHAEREAESRLGLTDSHREACPHPGADATNEQLVGMHCCRSGYLAALPELLSDIENRMPPEPDAERFPEERSCREAFRHGEQRAAETCARGSCPGTPETPCTPVRHLGCYHLGFVAHWHRHCDFGEERKTEFENWANIASSDSLTADRDPITDGTLAADPATGRAPASVRGGQ
jgi:hypothetical protein